MWSFTSRVGTQDAVGVGRVVLLLLSSLSLASVLCLFFLFPFDRFLVCCTLLFLNSSLFHFFVRFFLFISSWCVVLCSFSLLPCFFSFFMSPFLICYLFSLFFSPFSCFFSFMLCTIPPSLSPPFSLSLPPLLFSLLNYLFSLSLLPYVIFPCLFSPSFFSLSFTSSQFPQNT